MTTLLFVLFTQLHQTHSYFHLPTFFHHYANSTEFFIKAGIDFSPSSFVNSNNTASNQWIYHPCLKQNSQALISNIKTCEIGRMDRINFV